MVIEWAGVRSTGREGPPVLSVVNDDGTTANGSSLIDEIFREDARRMLAAALEAEVNTYIPELVEQRDRTGRRLVVRNGYHQARKVTTATGVQRCWVHKTANVLDPMAKSAQPGAKKAIQDIYNAEDRDHAEVAIKTFAKHYGAKFPKAVKKITEGQEQLLAFYDFPAEHWIHLRTTNPIESTFSTVRLRTKVTRGAGSRTAALAMVFKLVESAQQ